MHITRRQLALFGLSSLSSLAAGAELAHAQGTRQNLSFPRDFGAHPESSVEWWYLTGLLHLARAGGAELGEPSHGYQITFFRLRGPAEPEARSAFAPRQLILAHLALSDLKAGRHYAEQRLARVGFGQVAASERDCDLRLRDWSLRREPVAGQDAAQASRYLSRAAGRDFALDLQLQTTQAVLLQGEQGYSRKSAPGPEENFSYYYSQTQLATQGQLTLKGQRFQVAGRSWLDHERSDGLLGREAVGWDWLGINLLDGGALTLFRLRRSDGSSSWAGGSWRQADGRTQTLAAEQIRFTPGRRWHSPASQAEYPVQWRLDTPAGRFELRALMDAQELDTQGANGLLYWEGAAELLDEQGQKRLGLGYLEMTGYAARLALP